MTDEEFLALSADDAKHYVLQHPDAGERGRLVKLYAVSKGVNLYATGADSASDEGAVGGSWLGPLLISAGIGLVIWAFVFDVSAGFSGGGAYGLPERVANIDAIAIRHMILGCGLASFVSGWIVWAAEKIGKLLETRTP